MIDCSYNNVLYPEILNKSMKYNACLSAYRLLVLKLSIFQHRSIVWVLLALNTCDRSWAILFCEYE